MIRNTRSVSWIKAARKEFERFPGGAQRDVLRALTIAAEGRKADTVKLMKSLGSGVYEIALAWLGEAYRTVYIVPPGTDLWVVHAFRRNRPKASRPRNMRLT